MGSQALYQLVRAGFIAKHTTLTAWCAENGMHRQNATRALKGQSNGPAAQEMVRLLIKAAGIKIKKSTLKKEKP